MTWYTPSRQQHGWGSNSSAFAVARKRLTGAVLLGLTLPAGIVGAAEIVVNRADDPVGRYSGCTLRRAILSANTDQAVDTCTAGSGTDTISFDPELLPATIVLNGSHLQITSSLSVLGPGGGQLTISGNDASTLFRLDGLDESIEVTLGGMTLSGGTGEEGGAIFNERKLTLVDSTVTQNTATQGGGIFNRGALHLTDSSVVGNRTSEFGAGGGIYNNGALFVSDSHFGSNYSYSGGALFSQSSSVHLIRTQFEDNSASLYGGAVANRGELIVLDSYFAGNGVGAAYGGAIWNGASASLSLTDSILTNNSARAGGGLMIDSNSAAAAISGSTFSLNRAEDDGGAIFARKQDLTTIKNSTFSGNYARYLGAAIATLDGSITTTHSTFTNNTAGGATINSSQVDEFRLYNSIVANNTGFDCQFNAASDQTVQVANNVTTDGSCQWEGAPVIIADPLLGPLQDNGGPTPTHTLSEFSPAIDQAANDVCPMLDQSGIERPIDGNGDGQADCDIGAVEYIDLSGPNVVVDSAPDVGKTSDLDNYRVILSYVDGSGVDVTSIDIDDIWIQGATAILGPVDVVVNSDGSFASYSFIPPDGVWNGVDNGSYSIHVRGDEVFDLAMTGANAIIEGAIGSFSVRLPEIDVTGVGVAIINGSTITSQSDGTHFGDVPIGSSAESVFQITNSGLGTIELTPDVVVIGDGFSVTQPLESTLEAGMETEFLVSFSPQSIGSILGTVIIGNDDPDESPYRFNISGNGVAATELLFSSSFESAEP